MVAYSFKRQFVAPIRAGAKRQTIRADRKRHARPGESMQLYTGMRTRQCALIGLATCASVWPISIWIGTRPGFLGMIEFQGISLTAGIDLKEFARADGFDDWDQMRGFWIHTNGDVLPDPWSGILIRWDEFLPAGVVE